MLSRRTFLGIGASGLAASMAGCTSSIPFLGDQPMEFSATRATVPPAVLDETGYRERAIESHPLEETVEIGGLTQEIIVTNTQAEYDKAIDLEELGVSVDQRTQAAIFTVFTTPQISILGRAVNPVADMPSEELAEMVQGRYDGVEGFEKVGDRSAIVAGERTNVGTFEGEADLVAENVVLSLRFHIAEPVESGDDLVLAVGAYPQEKQFAEEEHVFAMMESIEHGSG